MSIEATSVSEFYPTKTFYKVDQLPFESTLANLAFQTIPVPPHTLIGVRSHNITASNLPRKIVTDFTNTVLEHDELGIEATQDILKHTDTMENHAIRLMRKKKQSKVHYLEEGGNLFEVASKYGIDPIDFTSLNFAPMFSQYFQDQQTSIQARLNPLFDIDNIKYFAEYYKFHPDVMSLNDMLDVSTRLETNILNGDVRKNRAMLKRAGKIFTWYQGRLRDFETIGPKIQLLAQNPNKRILFLFGSNHLRLNEAFLRGEKIEPPLTWDSFLSKLHTEDQEIIQQLHDWAVS